MRLREDRIVSEQAWTEDGIAIDLLRAGVRAEAIVLGFHEPAAGQELSGVILLGHQAEAFVLPGVCTAQNISDFGHIRRCNRSAFLGLSRPD